LPGFILINTAILIIVFPEVFIALLAAELRGFASIGIME